MLPSTRLVWWSRTRLSIPESLSNDCKNDRRTGSLVRSSSFIGRELREVVIGARGARPLTGLSANLCSPAFVAVKPVGGAFERNRQEKRVALVARVDHREAVRKASLDPLSQLLASD